MSLITTLDELTFKNGVPFVIWCYWEGTEMNKNRSQSFTYLQENIGVPVCLLTPNNLSKFILPEHPLPIALKYASIVHRSDFIRAYLMNFYGGGWHDIKATLVSFATCWDLFKDENVFLIGRPESFKGAAKITDENGIYMPDVAADLVSVPAWIARGQTPLSKSIYKNLLNLFLENGNLLKKGPAKHPREKYIKPKNFFHKIAIQIKYLWSGRNPKYPLPWTVFGNIFHPAVYKYRKHVVKTLPADTVKNAGIYHR
jgi:hypothetical protein